MESNQTDYLSQNLSQLDAILEENCTDPPVASPRLPDWRWVKGYAPNPGGRKKGSASKKTEILKKFTSDILNGGRQKFMVEMRKLEGKAYIDAYLALMEYSLPKMSRVESTNINIDQNTIKEVL